MFLLSIVLIFMPLDRGKSRKRKWLPGINFLAVKCDADFAELFLPPMHFRLSHYCCSFISASWWFCFIAKLLPSKIIWLYITKSFYLVLLAPAQLFCLAMPECCLPITVQSLSLKPFCFVLCTHTTVYLFFGTIKKFGISFLPLDKRLTFSHLLIRSDAEAEGTPKEKEGKHQWNL